MFGRTDDESATPLDGVDVVLADLDGVVYRGAEAIPHAVDALNSAAAGARIGYITNNASRTDHAVAEHLGSLGLQVRPDDVVTSPQAAVRLLRSRVQAGARILVVGGDGLVDELTKAGYRTTRSADDHPDAVVQGFAVDVGWADLAEASFALARHPDGTPVGHGEEGIPWIATNTDWTIPVARGIAPGNGTLVSAVHSAVGRLPVVAGKPEPPIFEVAAERFGAEHPLFIGDRLDTDISGANRVGMATAHVLTGVDRARELLAAGAELRPRYILGDLRELARPYPEPRMRRRDCDATVRGSRVRVDGDQVAIVSEGDPVDLVRAACAAVWGSGRPVYSLRIPDRLMDA